MDDSKRKCCAPQEEEGANDVSVKSNVNWHGQNSREVLCTKESNRGSRVSSMLVEFFSVAKTTMGRATGM
jgi:hypothetical protein